MKKYKDYMDRVELSGEAHDRILQAMKRQEAGATASAGPEKPSAKVTSLPWYRRSSFRKLAGVTAALIVLVVGVTAVVRNDKGDTRITQAVGPTWTASPTQAGPEVTGGTASNGTATDSEIVTADPSATSAAIETRTVSNATKGADTERPENEAVTDPEPADTDVVPNMTGAPVNGEETAVLIDCRDGRSFSVTLSREDTSLIRKMLPSTEPGIESSGDPVITEMEPADGLWISFTSSGLYYRIDPDLVEEQWREPLNRLLSRCGIPELK